jgi:hypothetical protein
MSGTEKQSSGNVVELPQQAKNDPVQTASDFVREHPVLTVAGGLALGVIAAALLPKGTTRRLAKRAISLAEIAGTAGALLGSRVRDRAEATGAGLREQGGLVADRLEKLGETASDRIGKLGGAASAGVERLIDPVESAAGKIARKAAELRSRVRH